MAHIIWTCKICSLLMNVEDGPAHIRSYDHKARLAQFSASVLTSRIQKLTLRHSLPVAHIKDHRYGLTGHAHVFAETFMQTEFSRYPAFAFPLTHQRTVEPTQTEAKLLDAVTVSAPSGSALWTCTICNREMQNVSKVDHLAGKAHARKLISEPLTLLVPLHVRSTMSGTLVANEAKERKIAESKSTANRVLQSWTCPSCIAIITFQQKPSHSCSSYDSKNSTIDGPLDSFFHSYRSFHYDASTPPAISFECLQNHLQTRHRWARDDPEREKLWHHYQAALTQEFNLWFGVEDDLDAWHSLCRAVRITPLPTTCELCRSVGLQPLIL